MQRTPPTDREYVDAVRHATLREREVMRRRASFKAMLLQDKKLQQELAEVVFDHKGASHAKAPR